MGRGLGCPAFDRFDVVFGGCVECGDVLQLWVDATCRVKDRATRRAKSKAASCRRTPN